ncbi:MAG: endonuclease [Bacilli bacterium]|nr:endonuclease [Bacilli bacterium]
MKKNTIFTIISSFLLCGSFITGIVATTIEKNTKAAFATYTNGDGATYYNGIDSSLEGTSLLSALQTLNASKRQTTVGYKAMGTSASGQFKYTDYDPSSVQYDGKGQKYGTKISSFYTYTPATSFNREHVWPNSHGAGEKGGLTAPHIDEDIHMTRPTISSENSSRGNSYYVEGMNSSSAGWDPKQAGYDERSRGEAARIILYCVVADPRLELECANSSGSKNNKMGNLETLLKWNLEYDVTDREKNRNEGAEYLQGNRNPFIDHPEYGCKIWGNANARTKEICNSSGGGGGGGQTVEHGSTPQDPLSVKEAIAKAKEVGTTASATYYTRGVISKVKEFSEEYKNANIYISKDGQETGEQLYIYRCLGKNGAKLASEADVAVGTKVIITGQLINFSGNTPEYTQGCYIYASGDEVDTINPVDPNGNDSGGGGGGDEPTPTPAKKKGCKGSVIAGSVIVSTTSLLGVGLLLIKKKKD